jgi:hypothetical protein
VIRIDFHQTPGGKMRRDVVLLDSGDDDFVGAPITSRLRASDFDVTIQLWREAGLNTTSTIRVHKLTVLAIVRRIRHRPLHPPPRALYNATRLVTTAVSLCARSSSMASCWR